MESQIYKPHTNSNFSSHLGSIKYPKANRCKAYPPAVLNTDSELEKQNKQKNKTKKTTQKYPLKPGRALPLMNLSFKFTKSHG